MPIYEYHCENCEDKFEKSEIAEYFHTYFSTFWQNFFVFDFEICRFSVFLHQTLFYVPSETKNTKNDFSDFALTRHSFGTKKIEMFEARFYDEQSEV